MKHKLIFRKSLLYFFLIVVVILVIIPSYYVKPKFVDFSGFSQIFSSYNRAIGDEQSLYLVLIS